MSDKPKVSIVSITYNQEKYIRQTLDGFLAQKINFDLEIIVADDCSTDNTASIILEYKEKHPDVFFPILRQKNIGIQKNLIDALQKAKGQYIALCEGDDYWIDPNKLQTQVEFLDKNPRYAICFHSTYVKYEKSNKKDYIYPEVKDHNWYTNKELLSINYIPTNSVMYRKQSYDTLPTNVMPLDWYLHLYHAQFGEIKFIDEAMSVYRKHEGGVWWEYDEHRHKIWKKYGLAYLYFLNEILMIYQKNHVYQSIIKNSIREFLDTLIVLDEKEKSKIFINTVTALPDIQNLFMLEQHKKIENQKQNIQNLTAQLLSVGDERNAALAELASIKNTRTWKTRTRIANIKQNKRRN